MSVTVTHYERGLGGKLIPIDPAAGRGLPIGTILHWGGNMGWSERDQVILAERTGSGYWCFDMDNPENNARLHFVEYHSIKREDDPAIWHRQHHFLTGRTATPEQIAEYDSMHKAQAAAHAEAERKSKEAHDKLTAEGRELWLRFGFGGAQYLIIAEHEENCSRPEEDLFQSKTIDTVILCRSNHGRRLFAELRKAALLIPETAQYGPGRDIYTPCVVANDYADGVYEGQRSPWHHHEYELQDVEFPTKEEAEAFVASKGKPFDMDFAGKKVSFSWKINKESVEHREGYTGGHGYYLGRSSIDGWQVRKVEVGNGESYYAALAKRYGHLENEPEDVEVTFD